MTFGAVFPGVMRAPFGGGAVAGNGLLNNLVDMWKGDEPGGANNMIGIHAGLDLTQVSSPGADTGIVYATARKFDGVLDYAYRASEAALQAGDVDLTWAVWVYPTSVSGARNIVSKWLNTGADSEYLLDYNQSTANSVVFRVRNTANSAETQVAANTFGALSANNWYFVVGWHDAANDEIGVSVNETTNTAAHTGGVRSSTNALWVAGLTNATGGRFAGRLGPVMVWKSAAGLGGVLTAAQRTALYNGGAGLPYAAFTT